MPDSALLQSPRNRFFAFSAVGVAMVCLPLWQVLHYQQSELRELAAQRALLDPVARAVHAQFGLLAHRQVSAQLLQGRPQLEAARRAVQVGVDEQLQTLAQELTQGLWSHALAETRDLTRDWQLLAKQVAARTLSAAQSDHAHALRLEQAVQVMDLVSVSEIGELGNSAAQPGSHRFAAAARLLTALATDLALAADGVQKEGAQKDGVQKTATAEAVDHAALQTRATQRLQVLDLALANGLAHAPAIASGRHDNSTHSAPASAAAPLRTTLAQVNQHTRAYLQALQTLQVHNQAENTSESPALARVHQAGHDLQQAQLALFQQALTLHKRALTRRQTQLEQQQTALLAGLALLSALALGLAAALVQASSPFPGAPAGQNSSRSRHTARPWETSDTASATGTAGAADAAAMGAPVNPTRVETARLMGRLRTPTVQPQRGIAAPTAQREPEDSLPPGNA